jgi:UDP-N-acetylmuramate--alanine ligase
MYNPKLHFHFTGIGGSGMSGIAEVLLNLGFKVSGSDLRASDAVQRLQSLGASVCIGHAREHVPDTCSLVVYSSAVTADNPELLEAQARNLPVVRRAEVLAELMRLKYGVAIAGSHGKTTTTSMTGAILDAGGLDPTVIVGGQFKSRASGGRLGKGQFLVAESDESDRSFLLLKPCIAIVTNIDAEHMQAYQSFRELQDSFEAFVSAVPFYGLAILCVDDPQVRALSQRVSGRKITYGLAPDAQIRAENFSYSIESTSYDVWSAGELLGRVELPVLGRHLAVNSLAAIAVGLELGIPFAVIARALNGFSGVKRRLEICGQAGGVTLINDYGHHPTEIRATLAAIRMGFGEQLRTLRVVFQPHRYSRTRDCFSEFLAAFGDAQQLVITDIYSAGEPEIEGISAERIVAALQHPNASYQPDVKKAGEQVVGQAEPGDVLLCLGAGSVGQLVPEILQQLERRFGATEENQLQHSPEAQAVNF